MNISIYQDKNRWIEHTKQKIESIKKMNQIKAPRRIRKIGVLYHLLENLTIKKNHCNLPRY